MVGLDAAGKTTILCASSSFSIGSLLSLLSATPADAISHLFLLVHSYKYVLTA
jgi:hypothetical protein